jgi:hypothetical protein
MLRAFAETAAEDIPDAAPSARLFDALSKELFGFLAERVEKGLIVLPAGLWEAVPEELWELRGQMLLNAAGEALDAARAKRCPDCGEDHGTKACPECGRPLVYGYGLMGGGMGSYASCDCGYFKKREDQQAALRPEPDDSENG